MGRRRRIFSFILIFISKTSFWWFVVEGRMLDYSRFSLGKALKDIITVQESNIFHKTKLPKELQL